MQAWFAGQELLVTGAEGWPGSSKTKEGQNEAKGIPESVGWTTLKPRAASRKMLHWGEVPLIKMGLAFKRELLRIATLIPCAQAVV